MVLTKKATDKNEGNYREIPDGFVGRFVIGKPSLRKVEGKYGVYYMANFPLTLTEAEQKRLVETHGAPEDGVLQSWRPSFGGYSCGWTLKPKRDGSWLVVDFLAAAFGSKNARAFRDWIAAGACPPEREEYTEEQNVQVIENWLAWVENLEIYGTVRHDQKGDQLYARFGGPMPVGSLPGQPEPEYQATGKSKLRAMQAESDDGAPTEQSEPAPTAPAQTQTTSEDLPPIDPSKLTPEQQEQYRKLFGQPVGAA